MQSQPRVLIEDTQELPGEACDKKTRMENAAKEMSPGDQKEAAECRVCFQSRKDETRVIQLCSRTPTHWVHIKCHEGLLKNRQHRKCPGCMCPTKLEVFENHLAVTPHSQDILIKEFDELFQYLRIEDYGEDLFGKLTRTEGNFGVVEHMLRKEEAHDSLAFAPHFLSTWAKIMKCPSDRVDFLAACIDKYYYLLVCAEGSGSGCSDTLGHAVLEMQKFDDFKRLADLVTRRGYKFINHIDQRWLGQETKDPHAKLPKFGFIEHILGNPAIQCWDDVQVRLDYLGIKNVSVKDVERAMKSYPIPHRVMSEVLDRFPELAAPIWKEYISGNLSPNPSKRFATWTVLLDKARPKYWCAASWDERTIPATLVEAYRPEYVIAGCTSPIQVYPKCKPDEVSLFPWDNPWVNSTVIFCNERGLALTDMDSVIDVSHLLVMRHPVEGIWVVSCPTPWVFNDPRASLSRVSSTNPWPVDSKEIEPWLDKTKTDCMQTVLRVGPSTTKRMRIRFVTAYIMELDISGNIIRVPPRDSRMSQPSDAPTFVFNVANLNDLLNHLDDD